MEDFDLIFVTRGAGDTNVTYMHICGWIATGFWEKGGSKQNLCSRTWTKQSELFSTTVMRRSKGSLSLQACNFGRNSGLVVIQGCLVVKLPVDQI